MFRTRISSTVQKCSLLGMWVYCSIMEVCWNSNWMSKEWSGQVSATLWSLTWPVEREQHCHLNMRNPGKRRKGRNIWHYMTSLFQCFILIHSYSTYCHGIPLPHKASGIWFCNRQTWRWCWWGFQVCWPKNNHPTLNGWFWKINMIKKCLCLYANGNVH